MKKMININGKQWNQISKEGVQDNVKKESNQRE